MGSLVRSSRAASILAYLLIVAVAIASTLLDEFLDHWSSGMAWIPLLNYARAIVLALKYGGSSLGGDLGHYMTGTFVTATISFVLGPVRRTCSPLFLLPP